MKGGEEQVRVRLDGLMSEAQVEIVSDHVHGQLIGQAGDLDRLDQYPDPARPSRRSPPSADLRPGSSTGRSWCRTPTLSPDSPKWDAQMGRACRQGTATPRSIGSPPRDSPRGVWELCELRSRRTGMVLRG